MENIHIFYCCIFELVSGSQTGTCVRKLKKVDNVTYKGKNPHLPACVCEREREGGGGGGGLFTSFQTFSDMSISQFSIYGSVT